MKISIIRILIIVSIGIGYTSNTYAYITVPSTSLSLEVGIDEYLPTPDAYYGYIDNAIWACSSPYIVFREKDAAGAIIYISNSFTGTALIEVVATERYLDSYGRYRGLTYYKQYHIKCIGGSSTFEENEIILPSTINLNIGETKHYKILSGNHYNGAFNVQWKYPRKHTSIELNYNTSEIFISGLTAGEDILTITTANGEEKDCSIIVSFSGIDSPYRRTEKNAVLDIKSLISSVLPHASYYLRPEKNSIDPLYNDVTNNIYTINGVLIKKNADKNDILNLPPGLYIHQNKKILVK